MRNDHKKKITGKLYGIGIGPGDPKLLTLKAKELLNRVDTVFVPKGNDLGTSCARSIVEAVISKSKDFIEITFPMTRDKKILKKSWTFAAREIAQKIRQKGEAAFVTIGDPYIYSTYVYLVETMRKHFPNINLETVPGVSAFNAASSRVDMPLAKGDEKLAILPVTKTLKGLKKTLREFDTIVLMKVGSKLDRVIRLLREMKLIEKAVLVSHVGQEGEKIVRDLTLLEGRKEAYLSVIIVKKEWT